MLSALALCIAVTDWINLNSGYLPETSAEEFNLPFAPWDFGESIMSAAEGDRKKAFAAVVSAQQNVLTMEADQLLAEAASCKEKFAHVASK